MTLEYLTKKQAEAQAWRVEKYWRERGHQVDTWIEMVSLRRAEHGKSGYVVRSNLVSGLPAAMVRSHLGRPVPIAVE